LFLIKLSLKKIPNGLKSFFDHENVALAIKIFSSSSKAATIKLISSFFSYFLLSSPIRLPIFSLFSNEPDLGTEIDPGMVMTPFPSSILGQDLNPQPHDRESNLLTTRPDWRPQTFFELLCVHQYFYKHTLPDLWNETFYNLIHVGLLQWLYSYFYWMSTL
jgi:hypothetical protein